LTQRKEYIHTLHYRIEAEPRLSPDNNTLFHEMWSVSESEHSNDAEEFKEDDQDGSSKPEEEV
jgi:hypothetical protein